MPNFSSDTPITKAPATSIKLDGKVNKVTLSSNGGKVGTYSVSSTAMVLSKGGTYSGSSGVPVYLDDLAVGWYKFSVVVDAFCYTNSRETFYFRLGSSSNTYSVNNTTFVSTNLQAAGVDFGGTTVSSRYEGFLEIESTAKNLVAHVYQTYNRGTCSANVSLEFLGALTVDLIP